LLVDARGLQDGERIEADVCIVGAGAAGITIARALIGGGLRVAVLESGGREFTEDTQELYKGESADGRYAAPERLRLRYFGGTTNHWEGYCRPLDPIDFIARPWVPYSGWPFSRDELVPHYRRAEKICQVGPFDYASPQWSGEGRGQPFPFDPARIATTVYRRSPPTRFGDVYGDELTKASNVAVYLQANVVEIEASANAAEVTGLRVATLTGKALRATARLYVLATGGIENARLLLVSDRAQRGGLGNGAGLVGRFFTDHAVLGSGGILPVDPFVDWRIYDFAEPDYAVLMLSETVQRQEELVNMAITLLPIGVPPPAGVSSMSAMLEALRHGQAPDGLVDHLRNVIGDIDAVAAAAYRKLRGRSGPVRMFQFHTRVEPVPNPENRVTLTDERDRLGLRRVRVDWRPGLRELHSVRRAQEFLGMEAGRIGFGRAQVTIAPEQIEWPRTWTFSGHHMGTTRMHDEPRRGVVDRDGRVHGTSNLYVAGSSVFPTFGGVNPTLTIVALALRTVDHVKRVLG
jgi:choline dehydrogenase-like flavoprotein